MNQDVTYDGELKLARVEAVDKGVLGLAVANGLRGLARDTRDLAVGIAREDARVRVRRGRLHCRRKDIREQRDHEKRNE